MAEFRNVVADGDLIRERQMTSLSWWPWCKKSTEWAPHRNLSNEVRLLEEMMHNAHAAYRAAQDSFVVAQKNVNMDKGVLRAHKLDNSEIIYQIPSDESILARRDGVKYSSGNRSGGSGGGNNNPKQNNGNGNNNQQEKNNQKNNSGGHGRKKSLLAILADAEVTLH